MRLRFALASLMASLVAIPAVVVHDGSAAQAAADGSGTLALRAALQITGNHSSTCPEGSAVTLECHVHSGRGLVSGLGSVTTSYLFRFDTTDSNCFRVLGTSLTLTVSGKGTIDLALDPAPGCIVQGLILNTPQSFTVVGGSGSYAGASGSGTVTRKLVSLEPHVVGTETYSGTLVVPGVDFDVTKPVLTGARPLTVRAPRSLTRMRVRYRPSARDDRDGALPVSCRPRSGTRFRLGRTIVSCSAVDTSGNVATARFAVTVHH